MNNKQNKITQKNASCSLIIGRFEPFHYGHAALLQCAFEQNPFVICAIGSCFQAPDTKNPFSFQMRMKLIQSTLSKEQCERLFFCAMPDLYDDNAWNTVLAAQVNKITHSIENSFVDGAFNPTLCSHAVAPFLPNVITQKELDDEIGQNNLSNKTDNQNSHNTTASSLQINPELKAHLLDLQNLFNPKIDNKPDVFVQKLNLSNTSTVPVLPVTLVGFKKDHSSYYLDNFPQFLFHEILPHKPKSKFTNKVAQHNLTSTSKEQQNDYKNFIFNATDIRHEMFSSNTFFEDFDSLHLPKETKSILYEFSKSELFNDLKKEFNALIEYKKKYTQSIAFTADALLEHRGEVLLIERSGDFGNKLLAIPGGFCEPNESAYESAKRELLEETSIDIESCKHVIAQTMLADSPQRSRRMHICSTVHHFILDDQFERPIAKAQDDAKRFFWVPKEFLTNCAPYLFEDHYSICAKLLNLEPFCSIKQKKQFKP